MRVPSLARALAAAALAGTLAGGCSRPPDEAWLRFLGFKSGDKTISVVRGTLDKKHDAATDVDAAFENASFTVGRSSDNGTGILVNRVHVEYSVQGAPAYDYPVTLYLAAPSKAGEPTTGTLSGLPVVPASLEAWIIANVSASEASFGARVTFLAEADNGTELETSGGLSIVLTK